MSIYPHYRTPYRDIVQDDSGEWVTRRGIECQACGAPWPCETARAEGVVEE